MKAIAYEKILRMVRLNLYYIFSNEKYTLKCFVRRHIFVEMHIEATIKQHVLSIPVLTPTGTMKKLKHFLLLLEGFESKFQTSNARYYVYVFIDCIKFLTELER